MFSSKIAFLQQPLPKLLLDIAIIFVWLVNGLFCKILNFVPRHQQIVGRILGEEWAWLLTKAIGVGELLIIVWIVSKILPRWCTIFQIVIVLLMNVIEFILVPDLLLFGKLNLVIAVFTVISYTVISKHYFH
jgi:hypothetical protein